MAIETQKKDRRTNVETVFDYLYDQISTLHLLPGDKISEAEIAAQFNVSRQPVRDAFSRLESLNLLMIRPQRATEVKRFSRREITKSRFIRAAIEAMVIRQAASAFEEKDSTRLDEILEKQRIAVEAKDYEAFGVLDYEFHQALCEIAKADFAFEAIAAEKAKVDRLCLLSLAKEDRMPELLRDHQLISEKVKSGDVEGAVDAGMRHLSRLDATITSVSTKNSRHFDP